MNKGCGREIGNLSCCTVINDDCNEHLWMLPAGCVDLVVSDPPYGMQLHGVFQGHHGPVHWDDHYPVATVHSIISPAFLNLPLLGSYFFCRWDNLWDHEARTGVLTLPKPKSMLVWHKVGGGAGKGDWAHEHTRDWPTSFPDRRTDSVGVLRAFSLTGLRAMIAIQRRSR